MIANPKKERAFTLLEMLAVVAIMLIMLGLAVLSFAGARPKVKVKADSSRMIAFLRNMWDQTRASGGTLVLSPDYESGEMSYTDPRTGKTAMMTFKSGARVIGIRINDVLHNANSEPVLQAEDETSGGHAVYISEGRGLTRIGVVFGIYLEKEETYEHLTLASLNLITGKGLVRQLTEDDLDAILENPGGDA